MKLRPLLTVADRVDGLVNQGLSPEQVARRVLSSLDDKATRILARAWLVELAQEFVRIREYQARRGAADAPKPILPEDSEADRAERERHEDEEAQSKFMDSIHGILSEYAERLQVRWTADLLASTFGVPGGRVTWGDATADDHRAHINIDIVHVEGYLRDAAMHEQAIQEIESKGVMCLKEALVTA